MPIMSSVFFPPTTATVACLAALAAFCAAISSCFAAFLSALLEVSPVLSAIFVFEVSMFAKRGFYEKGEGSVLTQLWA
jgi:hypothetical protein